MVAAAAGRVPVRLLDGIRARPSAARRTVQRRRPPPLREEKFTDVARTSRQGGEPLLLAFGCS